MLRVSRVTPGLSDGGGVWLRIGTGNEYPVLAIAPKNAQHKSYHSGELYNYIAPGRPCPSNAH